MIRRNKWLLGFSLIYWLLIIMGVILNILSLKKVPLENYGLRAYFFSPNVDPNYYIPGLYNIGVGYYFITFPSSKQYVIDNKVSVINKNLEPVEVTYSFTYRLNPDKIFDLYQVMGHQYEQYIIAVLNNIVSNTFMTLTQSNSRVTAQNSIVASINTSGNKISTVLNSAVAVEGLWISSLSFSQYQNSLYLSDTYQQSYETTQIQFQKTKIRVQSLLQQISLLKSSLKTKLQEQYNSRYEAVVATDYALEQVRSTRMSYNYLMKRIWTYYNSTKLVFP